MISSTAAEAAARKVRVRLDIGFTSNYFGANERAGEPHAFLFEGDPGYRIEPHFHGVDQFQVVVGGTGSMMKKALASGVLHYADAYTPYGPILADDQGLAFFTLRPQGYSGTHYMPGAKNEKKAPTGRNLVSRAALEGLPATGTRTLFEEPDGVGAWELKAAPHAAVPDPSGLPAHGGAYLLVFAGSMTAAGREYGERSCLFIPAGESAPAMVAGSTGVVIGWMQFKRKAAA